MIEKIDLNGLPEMSGELSEMRKQRAKVSRQLELVGNALDALDAGVLLLEQVEILKEEMATYNELLDDFNDANERVQGAQVEPEEEPSYKLVPKGEEPTFDELAEEVDTSDPISLLHAFRKLYDIDEIPMDVALDLISEKVDEIIHERHELLKEERLLGKYAEIAKSITSDGDEKKRFAYLKILLGLMHPIDGE